MSESARLEASCRSELVALVQRELDERRIAISRELALIPPPVPACDVDFNRLLEDRGRIVDELQRLRRLVTQGAEDAELAMFCRDSAFLDDALKQTLMARLEAPCAEPRGLEMDSGVPLAASQSV